MKESAPYVQSFRLIENSVILEPEIYIMLREIAISEGSNGSTYSQIISFLVEYYRYNEKQKGNL